MISLVIDTNVVVAAVRSFRGSSSQLLQLVGTRRFELNMSVALALEYESVLKRDNLRGMITIEKATELVGFLCGHARRWPIPTGLRPLLSDPKDEMVAELMIHSGADFLVTHNLKHFAPLKARGHKVQAPATVLRILRGSP